MKTIINFKIGLSSLLLLRSSQSGMFTKVIILVNNHRYVLINIAVLNFCQVLSKNTCDGVQFLLNLHVTLSCFSPLQPSPFDVCNRTGTHLLISMLEKLSWFCLTGLIALVVHELEPKKMRICVW